MDAEDDKVKGARVNYCHIFFLFSSLTTSVMAVRYTAQILKYMQKGERFYKEMTSSLFL